MAPSCATDGNYWQLLFMFMPLVVAAVSMGATHKTMSFSFNVAMHVQK